MSERNNKELIDKESWTKAPGVKPGPPGTHATLFIRDYSIECDEKYCITIIQGYWIWWCSAHHQPQFMCEISRLDSTLKRLEEGVNG